ICGDKPKRNGACRRAFSTASSEPVSSGDFRLFGAIFRATESPCKSGRRGLRPQRPLDRVFRAWERERCSEGPDMRMRHALCTAHEKREQAPGYTSHLDFLMQFAECGSRPQ